MIKNMLGLTLAETQGSLCNFVQKLSGKAGRGWFAAFNRFNRGEMPWLLKKVCSFTTPSVSQFVVDRYFTVGEKYGVKIGQIGRKFSQIFLEKNLSILSKSVDQPLIYELQGSVNVEEMIDELIMYQSKVDTDLYIVWSVLKRHTEEPRMGILSNDANNIFFIPDETGRIWVVSCRWHEEDGWHIEAADNYDLHWYFGNRVIVLPSE